MMEILNRPRRLRRNEAIRSLTRETCISIDDLVYPIFVRDGENIKEEICSMKGVYRYSVDRILEEIEEVASLGIRAVLLFGIPDKKDEVGSGAYDDAGVIQRAVSEIKKNYPQMYVITEIGRAHV